MLRAVLARPGVRVALFALVAAFALLGARALWDHDEGRYTNVALQMLASGDWLSLARTDAVGHWSKPPLTYWAIAASLGTFGLHEAAARLPMALAYLLCTALVFRVARHLAPGREAFAAFAFAAMLLPSGASQLITTDMLLAAFETLAMAAFVQLRFGDGGRGAQALLGLGFALAFLTKGPPALLPWGAMLAFDALQRDRRGPSAVGPVVLAVFLAVAMPWYVAVVQRHPGLLDYFLGREVVMRLATDEFDRNGGALGWLVVYAPTLLLGTLPFTGTLLRRLPALAPRWRDWRTPAGCEADRAGLLLALWIALPLLVFCVAQSRMPLYLLPLFAPIALVVARLRSDAALPRARWLVAWVALLLGLKLASAAWSTHKDGSEWAHAITARAPGPVPEVVFVDDMARYAIRLYLGTGVQVRKISAEPIPDPKFVPDWDAALANVVATRDPRAVWICREGDWPRIRAQLARLGYAATALGGPHRDRVIFVVSPARAPAPVALPPG